MSGNAVRPFFDSNILLYLADQPGSPRPAIVERLLIERGTISVQVLNEIAHVARRKFLRELPEIREMLEFVRSFLTILPITIEVHERGLDLAQRYNLSTYDAMIVAAASLAGCSTLYSEDLQHGQKLGPVRVVNPFLA